MLSMLVTLATLFANTKTGLSIYLELNLSMVCGSTYVVVNVISSSFSYY